MHYTAQRFYPWFLSAKPPSSMGGMLNSFPKKKHSKKRSQDGSVLGAATVTGMLVLF